MNVQEAVETRRSIRDFLPTPVAGSVIRRVLECALRAPSGGNVQPWHLHVVAGAPLAELKEIMRQRVEQTPDGEPRDYEIYPASIAVPYRDRRYHVGEAMYAQLGIPREDKQARRRWLSRNYQFFGAPLALFCSIDRSMGPPQWADLGMLLQTVMLLLRSEGLHSCAQESWSLYPRTVGDFLALPAHRMLFAGVAIGYANPEHPVNHLVTARAALADIVEFAGI